MTKTKKELIAEHSKYYNADEAKRIADAYHDRLSTGEFVYIGGGLMKKKEKEH